MSRKSPSQEGTVFQDESGRWVAMLELPPRFDGRRIRRKRRARTRAEALDKLRELRAEFSSSGTTTDGRRTVADAVKAFAEARKSQGLAPGTLAQGKWQLDIIAEGLGRRRLVKLTVADCDDFLQAAADGIGERRPVSRQHVGRIRFTLINVLANEIRVGRLARNVAELSILPSTTVEKKERRALNADELSALLDRAKGSRLVLIDLSGRNGLRPAEARALRWQDVDLDLGRLSVTGQLDRQNQRTKPKTKKSARTLQLDETTIARLVAWRKKQESQKAMARNAWIEQDYVATTARDNAIDRHSFAKSLKRLCTEVGIDPPISPYELRHTAITMQADAGHSSWEIADWGGTSEAMISEVYRHRLRSMSRLSPPQQR